MAPIPKFDEPLVAHLCGLHSKKYLDRMKELICAAPACFGRGFACEYGEKTFRYCHIHMAAALEQEIRLRATVSKPQGKVTLETHGKTKNCGNCVMETKPNSRLPPGKGH